MIELNCKSESIGTHRTQNIELERITTQITTCRNEIKAITGSSYVRGVLLSFIMFTTRISIFVSVFAYILLEERITAQQVFVITAFYNVLRQSMTVFFPQGIGQVAEARISIQRLNKFLLYDENQLHARSAQTHNGPTAPLTLNNVNKNIIGNHSDVVEDDCKGVSIKCVTAKWTDDVADNTLNELNLRVRPGKLLAVIGPVGSGKTSLLQAILKELPLSGGTIDVNGDISYASQEPWLFAGSVRQNILFGLPMDKLRYSVVVKRCALERDFALLPYGDKTIVGERGVSLSGGQRARINLARAVYKQADIYLLDDPLSAVDTHVGKQLFDDCIVGYLKEKTCILVTHQLQYLKEVDHIVVLENGAIKAEGMHDLFGSVLVFLPQDEPSHNLFLPLSIAFQSSKRLRILPPMDYKSLFLTDKRIWLYNFQIYCLGNYQTLKESKLDFARLLQEEKEDEEEIKEDLTNNVRHGSFMSTSSKGDKSPDIPVKVEEGKSVGSVSGYVYNTYLKSGGNYGIIFCVLMLFVLTQLAASAGDYFITFW